MEEGEVASSRSPSSIAVSGFISGGDIGDIKPPSRFNPASKYVTLYSLLNFYRQEVSVFMEFTRLCRCHRQVGSFYPLKSVSLFRIIEEIVTVVKRVLVLIILVVFCVKNVSKLVLHTLQIAITTGELNACCNFLSRVSLLFTLFATHNVRSLNAFHSRHIMSKQ